MSYFFLDVLGCTSQMLPHKMDQTSVFQKTVIFLLHMWSSFLLFSKEKVGKNGGSMAKGMSNASSFVEITFGSAIGKTCFSRSFKTWHCCGHVVPLQFKTYFSLHGLVASKNVAEEHTKLHAALPGCTVVPFWFKFPASNRCQNVKYIDTYMFNV